MARRRPKCSLHPPCPPACCRYLSTDHEQLRQAMRAKYPGKLMYFPAPPRRGYTPSHSTSQSTDPGCLADARCREAAAASSLAATMQEWWVGGWVSGWWGSGMGATPGTCLLLHAIGTVVVIKDSLVGPWQLQ